MIYRVARLFILILIFQIASSCSSGVKQPATPVLKPVNHNDEYGIDTTKYSISVDKVNRNETLADILLKYDIPYARITKIAEVSKPEFNVRKIKSGNTYRAYVADDSAKTLAYFIYDKDKINYIKYFLKDTIIVSNGSKKVDIKLNNASGVINSSLYETLQNENLSPLLAVELADVYAWQIDFYTIQRGDKFKVIYEEKYIGDRFIGIGEILAAEFVHMGNKFYAFRFEQDGKTEYFDEEGKSLQKEFLKAPLKYRRISSRFSRRRFHPILRIYRPHLGIDYAAAIGTPVQAVGDGVVVEVKYKGQAGRFVKIRHNSVYTSGYLHLSRYGKGIKRGVKVKQGQVIGYVGSSGLSTGPHLDFRFWKNGRLVNYMTQHFPSSQSVKKENMERFNQIKDEYIKKLNAINYNMPEENVLGTK